MLSAASTSSTERLDTSSGGALQNVSTRLWGRNLFQMLEQADWVPRFLLPLRPYSGTGVADPWIEFHIPDSRDLAGLPQSILLRLSCHWLLTVVPDQVIKETVEFLGKHILLSHQAIAADLALPSREMGTRPDVSAIIPRSDAPDDDLVIYREKADRPTVDWILSLSKGR
jgi:hypothetical protein